MKKSKFCILLSIFFFFSCNEEEDLSLNEIDNILDTFEEYVSNDCLLYTSDAADE